MAKWPTSFTLCNASSAAGRQKSEFLIAGAHFTFAISFSRRGKLTTRFDAKKAGSDNRCGTCKNQPEALSALSAGTPCRRKPLTMVTSACSCATVNETGGRDLFPYTSGKRRKAFPGNRPWQGARQRSMLPPERSPLCFWASAQGAMQLRPLPGATQKAACPVRCSAGLRRRYSCRDTCPGAGSCALKTTLNPSRRAQLWN